MKHNALLLAALLILSIACYEPTEELTSIATFEFDVLESSENITADGVTNYNLVLRLPGIRYGDSRKLSVKTSWGTFADNTDTGIFPIPYNEISDSYIDTIILRAGRQPGPFRIEVNEDSTHIETLNFNALPNYPSFVQVLSDSIQLSLKPGNTSKLGLLFFSDVGFPSFNTRFRFLSDAEVNIFPREVIIDSVEPTATLQLITETEIDTIAVFGDILNLGPEIQQPTIDTLKIAIIQ
ncbi:hypothetical protein AB1A65_11585 [Muricauda sp. ANG21]|uniref:hypothetical protein n=1 Tax=Allomuricauda sp. ANG21 TaxID=3042468 RepID=UPI0034524BE2